MKFSAFIFSFRFRFLFILGALSAKAQLVEDELTLSRHHFIAPWERMAVCDRPPKLT